MELRAVRQDVFGDMNVTIGREAIVPRCCRVGSLSMKEARVGRE